jgi:hypothetical protein
MICQLKSTKPNMKGCKSMTLPSAVMTQANVRAPKGIVYGPPGIGKTTFGAATTKPLIIDCENGAVHTTRLDEEIDMDTTTTERKTWLATTEQRGLTCRHCGCKHFRVIYTRASWGGRIMRRRECRHCGRRMTTWERSGT